MYGMSDNGYSKQRSVALYEEECTTCGKLCTRYAHHI